MEDPHERGIPSKHDSSSRIGLVPAFCTHRPSLVPTEENRELDGLLGVNWVEIYRTASFVGTRSRNKVFVGEPAEGSFKNMYRKILQPNFAMDHLAIVTMKNVASCEK